MLYNDIQLSLNQYIRLYAYYVDKIGVIINNFIFYLNYFFLAVFNLFV